MGGKEEGVKEGDVAQTSNPAQPPEWGLEAAHDHGPQREEHMPCPLHISVYSLIQRRLNFFVCSMPALLLW